MAVNFLPLSCLFRLSPLAALRVTLANSRKSVPSFWTDGWEEEGALAGGGRRAEGVRLVEETLGRGLSELFLSFLSDVRERRDGRENASDPLLVVLAKLVKKSAGETFRSREAVLSRFETRGAEAEKGEEGGWLGARANDVGCWVGGRSPRVGWVGRESRAGLGAWGGKTGGSDWVLGSAEVVRLIAGLSLLVLRVWVVRVALPASCSSSLSSPALPPRAPARLELVRLGWAGAGES